MNMNTDPFIDFRDVWLAYNDDLLAQQKFAVEAIDLQVRQGEFIAIVGPSGCGKSTFMKLATGLRMPSRGNIIMQQRASICRALIHEPKLLLLDEPFGALDAFTREELWCILRDLWTEQRFNVILVTHDLRESVFLADTVYVMSKSPGRFVARREIGLPRPRELEVTYTKEFSDIVHDLRGHIGASRQSAKIEN
jgi:ABC-type nitrate/sulfonate/bicarbonate transport system ATPase subunit